MTVKKNRHIVYSTNPNFEYDLNEDDEQETLPPGEQQLYVSIDRKKRAGKEVTLVEGFIGTEADLKDLAKMLKNKCGVGGSAKDNEIIIQGNHKDKIARLLEEEGFRVKKKGGN